MSWSGSLLALSTFKSLPVNQMHTELSSSTQRGGKQRAQRPQCKFELGPVPDVVMWAQSTLSHVLSILSGTSGSRFYTSCRPRQLIVPLEVISKRCVWHIYSFFHSSVLRDTKQWSYNTHMLYIHTHLFRKDFKWVTSQCSSGSMWWMCYSCDTDFTFSAIKNK